MGLIATVGGAVLNDLLGSPSGGADGGPSGGGGGPGPSGPGPSGPGPSSSKSEAEAWFDTQNVPFSFGRNLVDSTSKSARRLVEEFRSVTMGVAYAAHAATTPSMCAAAAPPDPLPPAVLTTPPMIVMTLSR